MWRWVEEELIRDEPLDTLTARIRDICARLKLGEPIQYITGRAFFFGLEIEVGPAVLIPRPETEELVYHALKCLFPGQSVLDIGCGSGCIPVALKYKAPDLEVWACDVSRAALTMTMKNAQNHKVTIKTFEADLAEISTFSAVPPMDMIISNPPYIQEDEKHQMTTNTAFEPDIALFSPEDALWAYRHIVAIAKQKLKSGGLLFFELNEYKAKEIQSLVNSVEFSNPEIIEDLQGKPRILKATKS